MQMNPKTLYEKYEKDPKIKKKTLSVMELFSVQSKNAETGRIPHNECGSANTHILSQDPVYMSNHVQEITLSIKSFATH